MSAELGGIADSPALDLGGRAVTYAELTDRIDAAVLPERGLVTADQADPVATLTTVLAARRRHRPVAVGPPGFSGWPTVWPAGTELIAVTAGTTGRPRPLARSWTSWSDSFAALTSFTGLTIHDRILLTGPLSSTLHLFAALHTLALGGELTDRPEQADAAHLVPTVLTRLLDRAHLPLRRVVVAGDALSDRLAGRAAARGIDVIEYYGAAELSFVAIRRAPQRFRPFPGVTVRCLDGLLWARSGYLSLGYAGGSPGPLRRDRDGFASVGDRGEVAADGSVTVRGRAQDAVTSGGHTVLMADVEATLAGLPGVQAAAVVGLPHAELGQVLAATVVLSGSMDLDRLRRLARQRLSGPALPRRWTVSDRLPVTAAGKLSRAALAAQFETSPTAEDSA